MLEGLDLVDWSRLTDAYGSAEHVPHDIRDMTSSVSQAGKDALSRLAGTIFHQGSRYRASAPAVPFLVEVVTDSETPLRSQIIDFLILLAVGYPENHLPFGFNPDKEFRAAKRLEKRVDLDRVRTADPSEDDDWDEGRIALWARDTYETVERYLEEFRRLARGNDEMLSRASTRTLAWFPGSAAESARVVREIIGGARSPGERANAILCLGILDHYLQDLSDVQELERSLNPNQPPAVRLAAAVSLGVVLRDKPPTEAMTVLLDAVQENLGGDGLDGFDGWYLGGPVAQAAHLIQVIRPRPTDATVSALCRAAESYDKWARAQVWVALLTVVFRRPTRLKWVEDLSLRSGVRAQYLDPTSLTANQLRGLQAINRNPIWERQESLVDHHMDVCMAFGLPWHRDKFRAILSEAEAHLA